MDLPRSNHWIWSYPLLAAKPFRPNHLEVILQTSSHEDRPKNAKSCGSRMRNHEKPLGMVVSAVFALFLTKQRDWQHGDGQPIHYPNGCTDHGSCATPKMWLEWLVVASVCYRKCLVRSKIIEVIHWFIVTYLGCYIHVQSSDPQRNSSTFDVALFDEIASPASPLCLNTQAWRAGQD